MMSKCAVSFGLTGLVLALAGCTAATPVPEFQDVAGEWIHDVDGAETRLVLDDAGGLLVESLPAFVFTSTNSTDPTPITVTGVCETHIQGGSYPNYLTCSIDGNEFIDGIGTRLFVYPDGEHWTLAFLVRPAYDATMFEFHRQLAE